MGVDHGHRDVPVAQDLLDGADVVAALQKVSGEGVTESVTSHAFVDARSGGGAHDGALNDRFMQVMAALAPCVVTPTPRRRKNPLPLPLCRRGKELPLQ